MYIKIFEKHVFALDIVVKHADKSSSGTAVTRCELSNMGSGIGTQILF